MGPEQHGSESTFHFNGPLRASALDGYTARVRPRPDKHNCLGAYGANFGIYCVDYTREVCDRVRRFTARYL